MTVHEQIRHSAMETLGARELVLGTAIEIGVVYLQTGNESFPLSGCGSTCD